MEISSNKKNQIVDGILWKSFILYFIPILISNIIQQSYSIADALIIGNYAGKNALGAIDAPLAYIRLLINTFIGLSSGGGIIISQFYGRKDLKSVRKNISLLLLFAIVIGVILSIIGISLASFFLDILNVPVEIYNLSLIYLKIYFSGTVFVFLFNIISGILQAIGDSKTPFIFLTISSCINIILDIIFVAYFKLGVAGAGIATVLSQILATILIFYKLREKKELFQIKFEITKENYRYLTNIFKLGFPMAEQAIIFSVSNMFMQREINYFGSIAIIGWSICGKADFIIWNMADSIGISVTTFIAQNYGAKKIERIKKSLLQGLYLGGILFTISSIFLYYNIEFIAGLFVKDQAAIDMTVFLLRIIAPFYIFYMFSEVFGGAFRGMGYTFYPMICGLIGISFFRIAWIFFILSDKKDLEMVIKAYPWSWIITVFLQIFCYFCIRKKIFK